MSSRANACAWGICGSYICVCAQAGLRVCLPEHAESFSPADRPHAISTSLHALIKVTVREIITSVPDNKTAPGPSLGNPSPAACT